MNQRTADIMKRICLLLFLAWTRYRRNKSPQTRLKFLIYIAFFAAAMLLFRSEKTENALTGGKLITESA